MTPVTPTSSPTSPNPRSTLPPPAPRPRRCSCASARISDNVTEHRRSRLPEPPADGFLFYFLLKRVKLRGRKEFTESYIKTVADYLDGQQLERRQSTAGLMFTILRLSGTKYGFEKPGILCKQCECPDTPEKCLPGRGPGERTYCAAAHPADAWF